MAADKGLGKLGEMAKVSKAAGEVKFAGKVDDVAADSLDDVTGFYEGIYGEQELSFLEYEEYVDDMLNASRESTGIAKEGLNSELSKTQINNIVNIPKGNRPEPSTYLSSEYINAHLAQFYDGISVIQTEWAYGRYSEINGFVGVPEAVTDTIALDRTNVSRINID